MATLFLDGIGEVSEVVRIRPVRNLLRDVTAAALRIGHPVYVTRYIAWARFTGSVLTTVDWTLTDVVSAQATEVSVIALQNGAAVADVEEAGMRLAIDLENGVLTIRGEIEERLPSGDWRYQVHGRRFRRLERSFTLPRTVSADVIRANFRDGVLHVRIPKAPESKSRTIQIRTTS